MAEITKQDPDTIFCLEYARTGDVLAAVVASGIRDLGDPTFKPPLAVIGQALLDRPEIQAAVKAFRLVQQSREPVEVTHRTIAASMDEVYKRAFQLDDMKACISARQLQANVLGLLEQKISITTRKSLDDMTTAELMAMLGERGRLIDVTPDRAAEETDARADSPEPAEAQGSAGKPARVSSTGVE